MSIIYDIDEDIDLEKQLVETTEECIICYYDKHINEYIVLECNHKLCIDCYIKLNKCPICLKPFNTSINIESNIMISSTSSTRATITTIEDRSNRENRENELGRRYIQSEYRIVNVLCNSCCFCCVTFFLLFTVLYSKYILDVDI